MKLRFFFIFAVIFTANIFAQNSAKVGMAKRDFVDEQRKNWLGNAPRPISTIIWYPTLSADKEEKIVIGNPEKPIFISGAAVRNAEISPAKKRYPLIVLSHGTGGSALQMMWLGQYLASRGFIVAAINHHGNTGAEENYVPQAFALWWERTQDLRIAIDKLLADSQIGKRIDAKKSESPVFPSAERPPHRLPAAFSASTTTINFAPRQNAMRPAFRRPNTRPR